MVSTVGLLALFATLFFASAYAQCPQYAEYTDSAPCEFLCGIPCDYKGVRNVCICMEGYLKNPDTGLCVPQNQCSIKSDVPTLRSSGDVFTFSCFT